MNTIKRCAVLILLAALPLCASAQELDPEVRELLQSGIAHHDEGEYELAIECYEQALRLAPDIPAIYYEIAFSHLYNGDPESALEYTRQGIDLARSQDMQDILAGLYELEGSALDDLGLHQEAVDVYLEAIARFGTEDTRLYYNLALTYYRMGDRDNARDAVVKSLLNDMFHPSSHFLLGKICYEQNRRAQSLYSLCYFLFLEPYTERAEEAYETIQQLILYPDPEKLFSLPADTGGNFARYNAALSLLAADASFAPLSGFDLLKAKLERFFTAAGKIAKTESRADGPWRGFYIPFFAELAGSEHFETFCRYISLSAIEDSQNWLMENAERTDTLLEWLEAGDWFGPGGD